MRKTIENKRQYGTKHRCLQHYKTFWNVDSKMPLLQCLGIFLPANCRFYLLLFYYYVIIRATWRSCGCSCSLHGSWTGWLLRVPPTPAILWFYAKTLPWNSEMNLGKPACDIRDLLCRLFWFGFVLLNLSWRERSGTRLKFFLTKGGLIDTEMLSSSARYWLHESRFR